MKPVSIGKHISMLYRHHSMLISHLFDDLDLSAGQYLFLLTLESHEGINQKSLSDLVMIDRANTNRAVKKLEGLGLVYSQQEQADKRNQLLFLTDQGKALIPQLYQRLQGVTQALTQGMTPDEVAMAEQVLHTLSINIQQAVKDIKEKHHS